MNNVHLRADPSVKERLAEVVERHLPGDFSDWKPDETRHEDELTILDRAQSLAPTAPNCAVMLYHAYTDSAEICGLADRAEDEKYLNELEDILRNLGPALDRLSWNAYFAMLKPAEERMSGITGEHVLSFSVEDHLNALLEDLRRGLHRAREVVAQRGTEPERADIRAAAVVGMCREVFALRTGGRAPKSVREVPDNTGEPVPFVRFAKDIFDVLGIYVNVSSALDAWRRIRRNPNISTDPA